MTWFKVDDHFWGHPKQTALTKGAVALWVRAGSWSANLLTDGFVPKHMVAMLGGTKADVVALTNAGLWESVSDGFQFHDWSEYQPTREQVEKKRDEEAERKAEWRRKRAAQKAATQNVPDVSQRDNSVSPTGVPTGVPGVVPDVSQPCPVLPVPDPTRPDPDISKEMSSSSTAPRKRGTRIADDFTPSQELIRFAADHGFSAAQAAAITAEFVDYWRGVAGAKGVKLDWDGTWRNWVRKQDPARVRVTNTHGTPGGNWTEEQLTAVLGPDRWRAPQPPPEIPVDEQWDWVRQQLLTHRGQRIAQAIAKQQGGVA